MWANLMENYFRVFLFKTHGSLILLISSSLFSNVAGSEDQSLWAPPSYRWTQELSEDQREVHFYLEHRSGKKTAIEFSFDVETGGMRTEASWDEERNLGIPFPGHRHWEPHPDFNSSLDSEFIYWMEAIGYEFVKKPRFFKKENGKLSLRTTEAIIASAQQKKRTSPQEFVSKIKKEIQDTRTRLLGFKFASDLTDSLDIFEPIGRGLDTDERRIDGFNLFPLQQLMKRPQEVFDGLQKFSQEFDYPLYYVLKNRDLEYKSKLTLLILLTHNHYVEENFVKLTALLRGVEEAWKVALEINTIYQKERDYWEGWIKDEKIDIDLDQLVLNPLFGLPDEEHDEEPEEKPETLVFFEQHYHYYGAFVMAIRAQKKWPAPESLSRTIVQQAGYLYKLQTKYHQPNHEVEIDERELNRISDFYSQGVKDAKKLKVWFR